MAEFDFDELDKAVSSLMQKQTSAQPASSNVSAATSTQVSETAEASVSSHSPATEPVVELNTATIPVPSTTESASDSQATSSVPRSNLAVKRRGKFMDVVHPSVPASTSVTPQRKAPARSGATMQPINEITKPTPIGSVPPRAVDGISAPPTITSATSDNTGSNQPDTSDSSDWPDPLDVMERQEAERTASVASVETTEFNAVEGTVADSEMETTSSVRQEANSPFLPDAKVEKRPLGAPNPSSQTTEPANEDAVEMVEKSDITEQPVNTDDEENNKPTTILPEEFNADVLSLESHDTSQQASVSSEGDQADDSISTLSTDASTVATDNSTTSSTTAASVSTTSLVGSLPPRQVTPTSNDDHSDEPKSSIFDTDDNHPMKHHTKHSSGWFAVVIIGSMLVIGAIGGVVVYLLNNGY